MIYTVTFNPAIDYIINTDTKSVGNVIRTSNESIAPGGKGINVSIVLERLGMHNTASGFIAGFTGAETERLLCEYGINTDFIRLDTGMTRINVKIKGESETEINARGPVIPPHSLNLLLTKLSSLTDGDILVLGGSIPKGVPNDVYCNIMKSLEEKNVKTVVDAEGDLLLSTLRYRPFLIKPNNHELGAIFNKNLKSKEDIKEYALLLRKKGARNVLVSMGADGAMLSAEDGRTIYLPTPKGILKNSTGAGDSSVAGFLTGYLKTGNYEDALLWGVCAGSATVFSDDLATSSEISQLIDSMKEIKLTYI